MQKLALDCYLGFRMIAAKAVEIVKSCIIVWWFIEAYFLHLNSLNFVPILEKDNMGFLKFC